MMEPGKWIALHPFGGNAPGDLSLTCKVLRRHARLSVAFHLRGDLSGLSIAPPADTPSRRRELWKTTCLELFMGQAGSKPYWEFNLSPSGHWNAYRFDDYRLGMTEERGFAALAPEVWRQAGELRLACAIDLACIQCQRTLLEAAPAAVIQTAEGSTGYWAPVHCGPRPDFHQRGSFALALAP